ncbi:hypothetical protein [Blastococcus sp. SYSU D00820]
MTSLTVPARFCGPPATANGGYLAGRLAALVGTPAVAVRLRRPTPLDRELDVRSEDGAVALYDGEELLARAEPATLELEVPPAPGVEEAAAAAAGRAWADHPFPRCFGCGPEREPGDGLRTKVGPLPDRPQVWAGVFRPAASLPSAGGVAAPETVWAALDCPSFQPLAPEDPRPHVLGTMTARQDRPVRLDADHVLLAWLTGRDGRRTTSASALIGPDGAVRAAATAIWFPLA